MVGSEGTLGIITRLTLKLHGIPETILAAVCPFASIEGACNATIAALQMGLPLARIELLDEVQIRACNAYSHLTLPETPTLFLEFHGTASSAREQVEAFAEIARDSDRGAVQVILDRLADDRIIGRAEPSGWYLARDATAVKLSALLRDLDLGLDAGEDLAFIRTQWRARLAGVLAGAGAAERAALDMDLETLFAPPAAEEGARPVETLKRKAAG
jgi:FAD/FMN-containing dehydrogenase